MRYLTAASTTRYRTRSGLLTLHQADTSGCVSWSLLPAAAVGDTAQRNRFFFNGTLTPSCRTINTYPPPT